MNIKLVVVVVLCLVILVTAKPNKKGKKNDKSLLEQYIELCEGLQDGEIENTEAKFDDVFTQLNTTCTDILAYSEEAQAIETLAKEGNKSGKKGGKKGGKGKGGKKNKENKAVERLMAICISIGVQNYLESFPDDTPNELVDIYVNDTYPICQEAYEIKTGGFEIGFIKLCKALDDGKVENTNPKHQLWFDWIEPVCESYNVTTEEDGIESDAEIMPRNKKEKVGKKGGSEVNVALVMLSQSCIKLKTEQPQNFTSERWRILSEIFNGICSMVLGDGPDNGLSVLCNGLDSGDIKKNKNKKYKKPFKMLEPVCEDILEEENKKDAVKQIAKQENKKGGGKEGEGGKKGGKGGKNKDKMGEAVMKLKEYCQWIMMHTTVGLPVDFPVDLRVLFMKMESVCKGFY